MADLPRLVLEGLETDKNAEIFFTLLYPLPADYLSKNEIKIIPNKVCILNLQDIISIDSSSAVIYKISYKLLLKMNQLIRNTQF